MEQHRVRLISTSNSQFKYYEGLTGILLVPPLGYSLIFQPDNIKYHVLTTSWLLEINDLDFKTRNSRYIFERQEEG